MESSIRKNYSLQNMTALNSEEYKKAHLLVKSAIKDNKTNKIIITFSYGTAFIFPYEKGLAVMEAFSFAEKLLKSYGDAPKIVCVDNDDVVSQIQSNQMYERIKVSTLLRLDKQQYDSLDD